LKNVHSSTILPSLTQYRVMPHIYTGLPVGGPYTPYPWCVPTMPQRTLKPDAFRAGCLTNTVRLISATSSKEQGSSAPPDHVTETSVTAPGNMRNFPKLRCGKTKRSGKRQQATGFGLQETDDLLPVACCLLPETFPHLELALSGKPRYASIRYWLPSLVADASVFSSTGVRVAL
jgi:hypothetical protein